MSDDKKKMDWMYGGAKSLIDHEKYLLGQKVDKNFDLFSKAAANEKAEGLDAIIKGGSIGKTKSKSSSGFKSEKQEEQEKSSRFIKKHHIKQYDPLMDIKMKEEHLKMQLLDNPVKMAKLQNIVKEEMQKKMQKILKKKMKKEKKAMKKAKERGERPSKSRSRSPLPEKKTSSEHHRSKSKSSSPKRARHDSSSSDDKPTTSKREPSPASDSDEERKKKNWQGYGLIKKAKPEDERERKQYESKYAERAPINVPWRRNAVDPEQMNKKRERLKLSEEEKKQRLEEMMKHNVDWRNEQRETNIKRAKLAEKELEELDRKSRANRDGVNLVQQAHRSGEADSLEDRLKRQRGRLQRNERDFNRSFARR